MSGTDEARLPAIDRQLDRPAFSQIADLLRDRIESGAFKVEDKLPSESQLMLHFDVARMTVRQALSVLAAEGLVRAKQGKGVFVRNLAEADLPGIALTPPFEEWSESVLRSLDSPRAPLRWTFGAAGTFSWARKEWGVSDESRFGRLSVPLIHSSEPYEICSFYVPRIDSREQISLQLQRAIRNSRTLELEIYSRQASTSDTKSLHVDEGSAMTIVRRVARDEELAVQFVSESLRIGLVTLKFTSTV